MTPALRHILPACLAAGLWSCAGAPEAPDLAIAKTTPATYPSAGARTANALTTPWWTRSPPRALAAATETAFDAAPDIAVAAARFDAARARKAEAEAARWFDVVVSGRASASEDSDGDVDETLRGAVDATLPLDISGRLRALRNAAAADVAVAAADFDAARLALAQNIALQAAEAGETAELDALIAAQIEVSETLLRLTELRFAQGQASIVDVLQQRNQLASLAEQRPSLAARRRAALNAISALTGANLDSLDTRSAFLTTPEINNDFAIGAPEDLLDTRPDLRSAKAALDAADARYGAALRDRLPSLSFTGSAVASAVSGSPQELVSATASTALTVFDTGAKRAAVQRRRAELEEAGAAYVRDWLAAVAGVDSLIAEERQTTDAIALSDERLATARRLLEAAQRRYRQGASDFLPVLDAVQSVQQQERANLSLRADLARTRINLHTALGLTEAPGRSPTDPTQGYDT
ncbi:MAG: TolC family protein [Pseudomonadota bacterium]